MTNWLTRRCTAFLDTTCVASGELAAVALQVKSIIAQDPAGTLLLFDDETSEQLDVDLRGDDEAILRRLEGRNETADPGADGAPAKPRGPGRPRLGVVSREITLLPRHWEWLGQQPGGASVTLRKLVESARREGDGKAGLRKAQDGVYRFMVVMAGNAPDFEEATRALYANDGGRFESYSADWPEDVRAHALRLFRRCASAQRAG